MLVSKHFWTSVSPEFPCRLTTEALYTQCLSLGHGRKAHGAKHSLSSECARKALRLDGLLLALSPVFLCVGWTLLILLFRGEAARLPPAPPFARLHLDTVRIGSWSSSRHSGRLGPG